MFAIIEAGGRQEKVQPGAILVVDRLESEVGSEIRIEKVLLISNQDGQVTTGAPYVKNAIVTATILADAKGPKIRVFKTKRRKQYRKTIGHRSHQTRIKVTGITI
jgi:large subunit ribosomal protein L21